MAVITVPIAGSIVLLLLILLATKLLRQDNKRQRYIADVQRQRQFKTSLLLNGCVVKNKIAGAGEPDVSEEFVPQGRSDENETNATSGGSGGEEPCESNLPSATSEVPFTCDRNINLVLTKDLRNLNLSNCSNQVVGPSDNSDEKDAAAKKIYFVYDKKLNSLLYSSLLSWGKWDSLSSNGATTQPQSLV